MCKVTQTWQVLLHDPHGIVLDRMERDAPFINWKKVVVVVLFFHFVRHERQLFPCCEHLHLRLLPIRLARLKFTLSVRLYLKDARSVLSVKIDAQAVFFDAYLPVPFFDANRIQDLVFVLCSGPGITVSTEPIRASQLYKPKMTKGVCVPVPHNHGRIRSTEPSTP